MRDHPLVAQPSTRHAILIGVNAGHPSLALDALTAPEHGDVPQLAAVLRSPACQFTVEEWCGAQGQRDALRATIMQAMTTLTLADTLLIYFSGHGYVVTTPAGADDVVLVTSDADMTIITQQPDTCLSIDWLKTLLRSGRYAVGHVLLIVDCCYSGLLGTTLEEPRVEAPAHRQMLASTHDLTVAREWNQVSLYTYHLINGLKGTRHDRDGFVTLELLHAYLTDRMKGGPQSPQWTGAPEPQLSGWDKTSRWFLAWYDPIPYALAVLGELPLDRLPPPRADLPETSLVPFTASPLFVGREPELKALAAAVGTNQPAVVVPAVATGLGGIGKTSLVTEFVYRYGWYFRGGVFWLNCADPDQIASQIAGFALVLGIDTKDMPLDEQVQRVLHAWQSPMPRLLIFDNCEDYTVLDQWKPTVGGCRVVVTARSDQWPTLTQIRLGVLSPTESRLLLQTLCSRLTDIEADAIAEDLGHLPLALHLAGSYLNTYPHHTVAQYRKDLTIAHRSLKGRGAFPSPTRHELDVEATFMLSFNQLDPTNALDTLALGMLDGAGWCAPGVPIPRDLVLAFVLDRTDSDDAVDALRRLQQLGLLDGSDAVVLHRLLAQVVQARLGSTDTLDVVEDRVVAAASRVNETGVPSNMLSLEPHLRYVTMRASARGDIKAAHLADSLGAFEDLRGAYAEAQTLYERSLTIKEMVLGLEHPATALSVNNVAFVLDQQGRYAESQRLYERALAIHEVVLGTDHPTTASSVNNLASSLWRQGRYGEAQRLFEQALAIKEVVLGHNHPDTARSANNLAMVLERQGQYGEAQRLLEQALVARESVLGADHPDTTQSVNNLAMVLERQGQYTAAQRLFERALAINEAVLGRDHPTTAISVHNLAMVLGRQGQYAEAQDLYERALVIQEAMLGLHHPDTAQSMHNLAEVLESQGQYAEAQDLYERALGIYEAVLGRDHPHTAASMNNLASVLMWQGQYAEAQDLYERALAVTEAVLGAEHPDTAAGVNNLAEVLVRQGRYLEAQRLFERALAIAERCGDVSSIVTTQYVLGQTLLAQTALDSGFAQLAQAQQQSLAAGMTNEAQVIAHTTSVWQAMLPLREHMLMWTENPYDHETLSFLIHILCQRVVQAIQLDSAAMRSWLAEQLVILRRRPALPLEGAHTFLGFLQAWLRNDMDRMARVEPQLSPMFADLLRQMHADLDPPRGMTYLIDQWLSGARDTAGFEAVLEQVCQAVVIALKTDDPASCQQVATQLDPLAMDDALPLDGAGRFVQTLQAWLRGDETQWHVLLPQLSERWHDTIQAIHHAVQANPDDTLEQRIAKQLQPYLNAAQQSIASGDATQRVQIAADLTALVERVRDGEAEDSPWMDAAHFLTALVMVLQGDQPDATQLTPFYQTLLAQMHPTPSIDTGIAAWLAGERDEASFIGLIDAINHAVVAALQGDDEPARLVLATQLDALSQRDDLPMDDARIFVQMLQALLRGDAAQWQTLLPQLSDRFQAVIAQMQIAVHPIYRHVMPLLHAAADTLHRNDPAVTDQLVTHLTNVSDQAAAGEPDDSPWMDAARALRAARALLQGEAVDTTGLAEVYRNIIVGLQSIAANRAE